MDNIVAPWGEWDEQKGMVYIWNLKCYRLVSRKTCQVDKYASTGLPWISSSVAGCQKLVRRDVRKCSSMRTISLDSGRIWGASGTAVRENPAMMWPLVAMWSPQGPYINTFTAIVDLSRFNNSCLKSPTSTLVDLTFQSHALRSFSLNQLRNLSL